MPSRILEIDQIPTLNQLYKSKCIDPPTSSSQVAACSPSASYSSCISLLQHDITRLSVSAIVNAANTRLLGGGGVDGAIHRAAGPELLAACRQLGGCETGGAKITAGFKLPAEYVIHAVGPVYSASRREESERLLRGAYRASLDLAHDKGCESVAFSTISTGVYGYPVREAAEAVADEVKGWLKRHENSSVRRIIFCVFSHQDEDVYLEILSSFFPACDGA